MHTTDQFCITGGKPLRGEVELSGAKNAASKLMLAALLTEEPVVIHRVPKQAETQITVELLQNIGAHIEWINASTVVIQAKEIRQTTVSSLSLKNRLSILTIAPLLSRAREAFVPSLGGDVIGPRPVNFHVDSLRKMGARVEESEDGYRAYVETKLKGVCIDLSYPSVGATETAILAGALADGRTVIRNAAIEPEVHQLIMMIQKMGGIIEIGAGREIEIIGVEKLHGCEMTVMPDRNEAVSYACMALCTHGEIFVRGAQHEHLITFLNVVRRIGGEYCVESDGIAFTATHNDFKGIGLETDTHPGFMTDWQQPFAVVLTQATGTSVVHETVYEDRFGYTNTLTHMGADISLFSNCLGELSCRFRGCNDKHSAVIKGPTLLTATHIDIPDIRAGLALVIAALSAQGTSVLSGVHHLDRGYERLEEKLRFLGANISRVSSVEMISSKTQSVIV